MGFLRSVVGVVVGSLVVACAPAGRPNTVFSLAAESGGRCPAGGTRLEAGPDTNGNGTLDSDEVATTQYICNGATGAPGAVGPAGTEGTSVLVRMEPEPSGANCPEGGTRVLAGPDANHDGVLGSSEVTTTSFVCDGARGPGITWVTVNGASAQALPNTGYVASNPSARVVITLPTNPAVGDLVQVTGAGDGGWELAQNAAQRVDARNAGIPLGARLAVRGGDGGTPDTQWTAVAASADGSSLVAAGLNSLYTSSDSGRSWTRRGVSSGLPTYDMIPKVASSADGQRLVMAEYHPIGTGSSYLGQIWLSSNGGSTWTTPNLASGLPTTDVWLSVASSSDGLKLIVSGRQLWTSSNGGTTWVARTSGLPTPSPLYWFAVASSADGSRLFAAGGGTVYVSGDGGATWNASGLSSSSSVNTLASSADGLKLVASAFRGSLWTSTNGGVTWVARDSVRAWASVSSSADGRHLMATSAELDQLYISSDFGVTWTARGPRKEWRDGAMSADGSLLVAAATDSPVVTSALHSTPGSGGGMSGAKGSALTLQYTGNDTFLVVSASGYGLDVW